ncbi:MAG: phage protease [Pseudomonadota bacterium]
MASRTHIAQALGIALCDEKRPNSGAPEWVHLLPLGKVVGRDGRAWSLPDPNKVIAAFQQGNVDLPIDFEHQSERGVESKTGPIPAAGWIKRLELRSNGIWGRVEWTEQARTLIAEKAYRYLSPGIRHTADGQIEALSSAGLVHHPNLHLTALASQEEKMDTVDLKKMIVDLLGMDISAPDDEVFSALKAKLNAEPDPEKYVPLSALNGLLTERSEHLLSAGAARVEQKVTQALATGHISPAMKEWATSLCTQNEASFDAFVAKSSTPFADIHKSFSHMSAPPNDARKAGQAESALASSICAQLGLAQTALND